jgi:hypothetical protein
LHLTARATGPALSLDVHAPAPRLILAGLSIACVYGVLLLLPFPLWGTQPLRPAAQTPVTLGVGGIVVAAWFWAAMALPFRPYLLALRAAEHVPGRLLVALTGALACVALSVFPLFGSDLFEYVVYARLWLVHGDNYLTAVPALHPDDWAFAFAWYPDRPNAYGPLWAVLSGGVSVFAGDSVKFQVLAFKGLALAGYGACCWLIWRLTAGDRRALLVFAWSPLVLFDVLVKGHNDVLAAAAALLALLALRSRAPSGSLVAGAAAGLVKLSALAIGPVLVRELWIRRDMRGLVGGAVAALALALALYAPFWAGPFDTFSGVWLQSQRIVWSPGTLLIALTGSAPLTRLVLLLALAVVAGLVLARQRYAASASAVLLLATLLLGTTAFFAHYLVPVIALAAVSANEPLQRLLTALSLGALLAYGLDLLSLTLGPDWVGSAAYGVIGSLLTLLPALGVAVMDRCRGSGLLRRRG